MSRGDDQPRGKRERPVECTTYLPAALKSRVKTQAAREQRSESEIVREALRQYYSARAHPATAPAPDQAQAWALPPSIVELVAAAGGASGARPRRRRRARRRPCDCCCCRR